MNDIVLFEGIEYKIIPKWSNYAISQCMRLINIKTFRTKLWGICKPNAKGWGGGYHYTRLKSDAGKSQCMLRHRLMLMAWRPIDDCDSKIVNHLNGKPGDDRLDNLEWSNHSQNLEHAIQIGLKPNCAYPVLIKDLTTGIIQRYPSIQHAGRALGKARGDYIRARLLNGSSKVYADLLQFKFDDGSEWPAVDPEHIRVTRDGAPQDIIAINVLTEERVIFTGSPAGQRILGVNSTTISTNARNNSNVPTKGWLFRYLVGGDKEIPKFTDYQKQLIKENIGGRIPNGVLRIDLVTRAETFYSSVTKFCLATGICKTEACRLCSANDTRDGYIHSYVCI